PRQADGGRLDRGGIVQFVRGAAGGGGDVGSVGPGGPAAGTGCVATRGPGHVRRSVQGRGAAARGDVPAAVAEGVRTGNHRLSHQIPTATLVAYSSHVTSGSIRTPASVRRRQSASVAAIARGVVRS